MSNTSSAFRPRDVVLLVLLALTWGNSFLFIKLAVAVLSPLWIVTIRMTIGGALLLVIATAMRRSLPRDVESLAVLAFVGVTGCALPWAGQAWAQRSLDSGLVSVLNSCTPVATLAFAVLAKQERLHRNRVVGLAVAVTGTLVVVGGEIGSGRSVLALLAAVLATTGYALAAVVTRARISGRVANLPAAATQLCFGAVAFAPAAWSLGGTPPTRLAPVVLGALLALGLFGTGLAFLVYFALIESVGATNASMVTYLAPIVGLASGAVFRGERFGPNVFVGAAALIGGVWLAQRQPLASRLGAG
jgi:drug/metabolite transporter (DMT)-like permease